MRAKNIALLIAMALVFTFADGVQPNTKSAAAQEVQLTGPLAGAKAVHRLRLWRKGRAQLQPFFGVTLQNEFSRTFLVGAQLKYHFTDWLGLGVWGGYAIVNLRHQSHERSRAQNGLTNNQNRLSLPTHGNFKKQIGKFKWMAGIDVNFIPLRGKISLFQKVFMDTDLQLFAGVAFIGLEERADTVADVCEAGVAGYDEAACLATQTARSSRVAIAPSFGVGINTYFNEFMGLSIQWRGIPFKWNASGTDQAGNGGKFPDSIIDKKDRLRHFNHMFTMGFVVFFPPKIKVTE